MMVCALLVFVALYIYYKTVREGLVTKENCEGECTPEDIAWLNLPEEEQRPKKITQPPIDMVQFEKDQAALLAKSKLNNPDFWNQIERSNRLYNLLEAQKVSGPRFLDDPDLLGSFGGGIGSYGKDRYGRDIINKRINNENIGRQNETLARQIKEKVKRAEQIEQRAIKREKIISKRNLKKASNRRNYLAQSFGYD